MACTVGGKKKKGGGGGGREDIQDGDNVLWKITPCTNAQALLKTGVKQMTPTQRV